MLWVRYVCQELRQLGTRSESNLWAIEAPSFHRILYGTHPKHCPMSVGSQDEGLAQRARSADDEARLDKPVRKFATPVLPTAGAAPGIEIDAATLIGSASMHLSKTPSRAVAVA